MLVFASQKRFGDFFNTIDPKLTLRQGLFSLGCIAITQRAAAELWRRWACARLDLRRLAFLMAQTAQLSSKEMGMPELFVSAASCFSALVFAAGWGAHLFDTTVLVPTWTAEAPKSLLEFNATPYAARIGSFFRTLVPGIGVVALFAAIVAVVAGLQMHIALAVAGACGLIHLAMIFLFFIPTNVRLGLIPGGADARSLDPQVVKSLVQRWVGWNYARLGVDTVGLIAALFAFRGS